MNGTYIVFLQIIVYCQCLHAYRRISIGDIGDSGTPLFLTPLIENGDIEEAKRLARVTLTDAIGVESYAGYFTVNKTYDSNQFFWYFPSMALGKKAPVLVWLQGGPGGSSLFGQFMAHGPIATKNNTFERRDIHWAMNHHVIYIDNPVGAGFSYTRHPEGYCADETQVGEQLYSTVTQFFKLFPELQQNDFYAIGESYGGKFAVALAYNIYKKNPAVETKINLQGFAVGDGLCDPQRQFVYSTYLYQIGLIDWNAAAIMAEYEVKMIERIKDQQWENAYEVFAEMFMGSIDNSASFFLNNTHYSNKFNFLHWSSSGHKTLTLELRTVVNKSEFRRAVHVGDLPFNSEREVKMHMKKDIMQSVVPWLSELLEHYRVLIYSGQLDIILPYPGTVDFLRHLKFSGAAEYEKAARDAWKVDGEIAGYVKQAGRLTELMVRDAGHMVPMDQPKWALDMITRFTHQYNYRNISLINLRKFR